MLQYSNAFSSFSVSDLAKAKNFYSSVMGLTVSENAMGFLTLHMPNEYEVMLYPKSDHEPATFTVLNFTVRNIEESVDELIRLGIKFEQYSGEIETDEKGISRAQGIQIAWFRDPSGNILSILQTG